MQSAISAAPRKLPPNMPTPPTLRKVNPADTPIMFMALRSDTLPLSKVDEYAETLLARQLSTLDGVAQVNVYGAQKYAVRIQADPAALATRQIGIDQLANADRRANVNVATGTLNGPTRQSVIHANGQLDERRRIRAADRRLSQRRAGALPGRGARHRQRREQPHRQLVQRRARHRTLDPAPARLQHHRAGRRDQARCCRHSCSSCPPRCTWRSSTTAARRSALRSPTCRSTLLIAGVLVVGVIFVFLRRVSATIIPSLALPIAVIGTFAGMSLFGYNLDNLSLMALTLSVGFVVDDAIVMLENIVRHIEEGETPYEAALKGSREIGFTILSMTISLAAVFIPIVFMGGIVGRLLHEFAVTIILAICSRASSRSR